MTKYQYQNVCLNMCIQNIKYELFSSFIAFSKLKIALSGIKRLVEVFPDPALSNGTATENATGPQLPNNTVGLVYENANIFPGKYKCVVSLQIQ